jgi:hypothetical protein
MLLRGTLLLALAVLLAAGCSIDRVEWETSGFPVEDVAHAIEEEHHVSDPTVECIQREVQGAEWECRAHAGEAEYHCHVLANQPRERIYEVHCEAAHGEEDEESDGHEDETSTTEHEENAPAETEPAEQEDEPAEH